ncbi:MAG: hypothetical protein ACXVPU_09135 [Bacteroidia bacterium]
MMTKDYSKEIYKKYYTSREKLLQIVLKDGSILRGFFVGAFHGDTGIGEPYVTKWHFIDEQYIEKYHSPAPAGIKKEFGRTILQEEIKDICFCTGFDDLNQLPLL